MKTREIRNAKISSTFLGREDHGIPTCFLNLDYGGSGQGFGGYDLRHYGVDFITRILGVVGVEKWEQLAGKYVRADIDEAGIVRAIGNIVDDKWYRPESA